MRAEFLVHFKVGGKPETVALSAMGCVHNPLEAFFHRTTYFLRLVSHC